MCNLAKLNVAMGGGYNDGRCAAWCVSSAQALIVALAVMLPS
jgi:hypothetical protein